MKKYFILLSLSFLTLFFISCEEEPIGQYPIDNIPPQPVTNIEVENLPGAVKVTYNLPNEKDLLYVKAVYELPDGSIAEEKTSVFSNTMQIKGFGKSKKHTIHIVAVDRSRNESQPVPVEIEPLDAPIYEVIESLKVETAWGGFKLFWDNPLNANIVLEVLEKNDTTGNFVSVENFYSSEAVASKAVRGLDSTLTSFGFYIRDIYNNYTDTLILQIKPLFEQKVPKSGFKSFQLNSLFTQHSGFGGPASEMWDDIVNVRENCYYIRSGNPIMPFFTIDIGEKVKLSRFRIWQRVDYLFALHNPKLFEWYGTNDVSVANDNETLEWEENPAWVKLGSFESKRPSGGMEGDPVTSEDQAYALAGEEWEIPMEAPPIRYLRFKLIGTWSGSSGLTINELSFWGLIEN
jgi:hypothetical protein